MKIVSKAERQKAYQEVFGAALEANAKYGVRKKGQPYDQQVRKGKTKKDKQNS